MRDIKPEKGVGSGIRAGDLWPPTSVDEIFFELAVRDMAAEPQIKSECQAIAREFAASEMDGLPAED